jgi:hypothetical protein
LVYVIAKKLNLNSKIALLIARDPLYEARNKRRWV